jgi:glycosyltransferase involved in cell wall biosynthesis
MGIEVTTLARLPQEINLNHARQQFEPNVVFLKTPSIRIVSSVLFATKLFLWLVRNRRDVGLIHVHLANLAADVASLFGKLFDKPVYIKVASGGKTGEIRRFKNVAKFSNYFGLRNADRIQAISSEILDELASIGIPRDKIVSIPNGVEAHKPIENSSSSRVRLRDFLKVDSDYFIFLYLGRKASYKGIATLIQAWEMSRLGRERALLLLVGPEAEDSPIEVRSDHRRGIHSLEATSNPELYLRGSNVFVLPSFAEGMSNSLLEAISFGLPCIASKVGANTELLVHGQGGDLFEAGNVQELSSLMRAAYESRSAIKSKVEKAMENSSKYQIDLVMSLILKEYREIGYE